MGSHPPCRHRGKAARHICGQMGAGDAGLSHQGFRSLSSPWSLGERRYPVYRGQTQTSGGRVAPCRCGSPILLHRHPAKGWGRSERNMGVGSLGSMGQPGCLPLAQAWGLRTGADCTGGNAAGGRSGKVADREDDLIQALAEPRGTAMKTARHAEPAGLWVSGQGQPAIRLTLAIGGGVSRPVDRGWQRWR
jgi:hypothetical protein